jgi:hypothetical protein
VTVQSQDANGNPSGPTSKTTITLSNASGGGTLSGTLTGTISTCGNSATISTPVYSKSDTMTLTATAGETSLTAVTSGNIVHPELSPLDSGSSESGFAAGFEYPSPLSRREDSNRFGCLGEKFDRPLCVTCL